MAKGMERDHLDSGWEWDCNGAHEKIVMKHNILNIFERIKIYGSRDK